MNTLVSIVIPAYNHAAYLAEAVKSVLAQDYPALELIVIDDGSTDNTRAVLQSLGDGFHWETQANAGQSRTLARGWAMARGDILAYLSADDVLAPGAVRRSVEVLEANPALVATYCDFTLIDPQSRNVRRVNTPDFSYAAMLGEVSCPVGPGAFFRRQAYELAGPWNPSYRQMPDYDFWLRMGLFGGLARIPEVLAGFRVHEGSQTYSQTTPERAAEPVNIVAAVLQHPAAGALDPALKQRALASANLVSAQLDLRAGRYGDTLDKLRQASRHSPAAVYSPRTLRLLFNAVFNRVSHRLLWQLRSLLGRGQS